MTADLETKIVLLARAHGLDPALLRAQVATESGGDPWAYNPEQRYVYFWDVDGWKPFRKVTSEESASEYPPRDFPTLAGDRDQEWWAQQASWGIMQVMGAVAREHGYREPWLTRLCDLDVGLLYGCKVMQSLMRWSGGVTDQALAAYNGGRAGNARPPYRNAAYVAKVHSYL
jgi:soluble lytic murein transglycosylase-like protein